MTHPGDNFVDKHRLRPIWDAHLGWKVIGLDWLYAIVKRYSSIDVNRPQSVQNEVSCFKILAVVEHADDDGTVRRGHGGGRPADDLGKVEEVAGLHLVFEHLWNGKEILPKKVFNLYATTIKQEQANLKFKVVK